MTRRPASLASCPAIEPTAPEAAETNIVSPGRTSAMSCTPTHAVSPGMPSTPRYADTGTPSAAGSTGSSCRAGTPAPSPPAEAGPARRPGSDPVAPRLLDDTDGAAVHRLIELVGS